jgi:site-specific recombinase XerC
VSREGRVGAQQGVGAISGKHSRARGSAGHMSGMRLDQALAQFTRQLDADGRSPATRAQYVRHLATLVEALGAERELDTIGPEDVAQVLTDPRVQLRQDGARKLPASVNAFRSSLRAFFGYVTRAGYCAQDPARLVRRARCAPGPPRTLAPEDVAKLLATVVAASDATARRDHAMLALLAGTGIRVGSLVSLDIADFVEASSELRVLLAKGNAGHTLVLSRQLCAHLAAFTKGCEHGPLFAANDGRRLSVRQIQRRLGYWLERAGIATAASPHSLRHSFATRLYQSTGDILLVKEALGHASITSSVVYARVDRRTLRQAIEAMGEMSPKEEPAARESSNYLPREC